MTIQIIDEKYRKIAFDVLAQATALEVRYLNMILNAKSSDIRIQKQNDYICMLVENTEDRISQFIPEWAEFFGYRDLSELGAKEQLAKDALKAVVNNDFRPFDEIINDYVNEQGIYLEHQDKQQKIYEDITGKALSIFFKGNNIDKAYKEAYDYIYNNTPEIADPDVIAKIYEDLENEYYETKKLVA